MKTAVAALAVLVAARAGAHIVPIPPSVCSPDVALSVPGGPTGATAAAGPADALRVRFDAPGSEALFCPADPAAPATLCAPPSPRAFTLGDATGTLTFPPRFTATVYSSGDVDSPGLRLVVASGGRTTLATLTLTSGLAAAGDQLVEGASIGDFGSLTLVGVTDAGAVSPALAGQPLVLRLACRATPAPDIDQFRTLPQATLAGTITPRRATIRALLTGGPATTPPFAGTPAMVRLRAGDTMIASAFLPAGIAASGRRFTATTPDGKSRVTVKPRRDGSWVLTLVLDGPTMPPEAGGRALVDLTLDAGGVLARGERLFVGTSQRLRGAH